MTKRRRPEVLSRVRAQGGFTLIEVMVALVITALGMAALLGTLSSAADGASYLRDKMFAQWVALNQIAIVRLQQTPPSIGDSTGEVEMANRKWTWQQKVAMLDFPGIVSIEVSVRPADAAPAKGTNQNWVATVTGVRGDKVSTGRVTVTYNDITTANEQWGQQHQEMPYSVPTGTGTTPPAQTPVPAAPAVKSQ